MSTPIRDTSATATRLTVVPLELRARVLASIRGGLSVVAGVAAALVGGQAETTFLGWLVGATLTSIILAGDRRGRFTTPPEPLPAGARTESAKSIARTDVFPSTVLVAVIALATLAFDPVIAGIMAGILGGMAVMTVFAWVLVAVEERQLAGVLSFERGSRRLFIRT